MPNFQNNSKADFKNGEVLDLLNSKILKTGLAQVSEVTKISPSHLWNIINKRKVYPLSEKMKNRIKESGVLV